MKPPNAPLPALAVVLGLLVAGLTGPGLFPPLALAQETDFQTGVDAYHRGEYAAAFEVFQTLANRGHIDAQNNLGVLYQTGRGTPPDPLQAARWYRLAAQRGHADAQGNLAALYVQGLGVEKDLLRAYAWFNRAALQGDTTAAQNRDTVAEQLSAEQVARASDLELFAPLR
ncbi:MAG: tetratricopeptide repeat protein, partial [Candidatus Competibacterales bacterium]